MFCATGHVFVGSEGVGSRFHVLRARTRFRRYRWRPLSFSCFCAPRHVFGGAEGVGSRFSCFALSDTFSAVPRASGSVFMCCVPVLVFGDSEGVGSRFHVLRSRTHFRRCGGRMLHFSCFALPDSFSAVPRASAHVFMCCAARLVFDGSEGVGSRFHDLRRRTRFWRDRGLRVPFSCFVLPDSFLAVRRA
jgi:hypothetical protein